MIELMLEMKAADRMLSTRTIRVAVISVGALLLLWISVAISISTITESSNPAMALKFWAQNGFASAHLAERHLMDARSDHAAKVARIAARDALKQEPSVAVAARVLGFADEMLGDRAAARRLMLLSNQLGRRDPATSLWLIEDAVARNDITAALKYFDTVMRTSVPSRSILFPVLDSALADPVIAAQSVRMFEANPNWLRAFLQYAFTSGRADSTLVNIVNRLPASVDALTLDMRKQYVGFLAERGNYSGAHAVYTAANSRTLKRENTSSWRDTQFSNDWPIFEWVFTSELDYGGERAGPDGGMAVFAEAGPTGLLARRLLSLPSGTYELATTSAFEGEDRRGLPFWSMTCANKAMTPRIVELQVQSTRGIRRRDATRFAIPATECNYQWMTLNLPASLRVSRLEGVVFDVSVR